VQRVVETLVCRNDGHCSCKGESDVKAVIEAALVTQRDVQSLIE
jgi:hypothetical protein